MGRHRAGVLAAVVLALPAGRPVAAQEPPARVIRAFAEVGVAATTLHGELTPVFTLAAGLSLAPGFSLGGAAHLLPGPVEVGEVVLRDVELDLGYGGLLLHFRRPGWSERSAWTARLLVGAGNADVRERATSLPLDSDNFLVLDPSIGVDVALVGRLRGGVALSYRFVWGVEDLRGVTASDLRAPGLAVNLRIAPL